MPYILIGTIKILQNIITLVPSIVIALLIHDWIKKRFQ